MKFKTIEWKGDRVRILDQRDLPQKVHYLDCRDAFSVAQAIRNMAIRGAPAIGVAAAMGIALAAKKTLTTRPETYRKHLEKVCHEMRQTRPTAVNLFWAVDRMKRILDQIHVYGIEKTKAKLVKEALRIYKEDVEINKKIGEVGKRLINNGDGVLTHCNAGALATAGLRNSTGSDLCCMERRETISCLRGRNKTLTPGSQADSLGAHSGKNPGNGLDR